MKRRRLKDAKFEYVNGKYQPVLLEEHVLKEIVTRLWWAKIKVYRINCPVGGKVRPNEPGIPDLAGWVPAVKSQRFSTASPTIALCPARPVFLEVKRPGGVRRPAQIRFIEEAKSDGCVAGFVESWEDVVQLFSDSGVQLNYDVGGKL